MPTIEVHISPTLTHQYGPSPFDTFSRWVISFPGAPWTNTTTSFPIRFVVSRAIGNEVFTAGRAHDISSALWSAFNFWGPCTRKSKRSFGSKARDIFYAASLPEALHRTTLSLCCWNGEGWGKMIPLTVIVVATKDQDERDRHELHTVFDMTLDAPKSFDDDAFDALFEEPQCEKPFQFSSPVKDQCSWVDHGNKKEAPSHPFTFLPGDATW